MQKLELKKSVSAGVFSIITIGLLTGLTYKTGLCGRHLGQSIWKSGDFGGRLASALLTIKTSAKKLITVNLT